jgi:hypothetical protein
VQAGADKKAMQCAFNFVCAALEKLVDAYFEAWLCAV